MTLIGSNVEFILKDKIIDDTGRYIIICCEIQGSDFVLVNTYIPNTETEQVAFLKDMSELLSTIDTRENIIWGGDFNCCFEKLDTEGGNFKPKRRTINYLNEIMEQDDLCDIWRIQNPDKRQYTWRQKTPFIQRRLDFYLISNSLQSIIHKTSIISSTATDHSAIKLEVLSPEQIFSGPSHWRFNVSLLDNTEYVTLVREHIPKWKHECGECEDAMVVWEYFKFKVREFTIKFSKRLAAERRENITNLEKQIYQLEINLDSSDPGAVKNRELLQEKLDMEYENKAKGSILRSKVKFYEEGKKCTKYFLCQEKSNKRKTTVRKLIIDNKETTDSTKIMENIKKFYWDKYHRKCSTTEKDCCEFLKRVAMPSLTKEQAIQCDGVISKDEILAALNSMQNNKSPGNDGLPKEFYLYFFEDICIDLVKCINMCWEVGHLTQTQSQALITLIQKPGKDVRYLNAWRPISLINVDAKLISKVLAKRINQVLPLLRSEEQSAFVSGRYIGEPIRLISDILHETESRKIPGLLFAADFQSAFDSIDFCILFQVLKKFGFNDYFINWIRILHNNSYSMS